MGSGRRLAISFKRNENRLAANHKHLSERLKLGRHVPNPLLYAHKINDIGLTKPIKPFNGKNEIRLDEESVTFEHPVSNFISDKADKPSSFDFHIPKPSDSGWVEKSKGFMLKAWKPVLGSAMLGASIYFGVPMLGLSAIRGMYANKNVEPVKKDDEPIKDDLPQNNEFLKNNENILTN